MALESIRCIVVWAESGFLSRITFEEKNYQLLAFKRVNRVWDGELSRFKKRGILLGVRLSVADSEFHYDYFIFKDKTFSPKAPGSVKKPPSHAVKSEAKKSYNGKME
jgi:hypothetical protein